MPRFSVWTVRLAFVYLFIGFTLGALMLANKGMPLGAWVWRLLPAHIDFLLFGFVIQLTIGIAYWILPRYRTGSRGNESAFWISVALLNLGVWTVACIGFLNLPGLWLVIGRLLVGIAAALFGMQAWRRIRAT
jgi:hypothetical protein